MAATRLYSHKLIRQYLDDLDDLQQHERREHMERCAGEWGIAFSTIRGMTSDWRRRYGARCYQPIRYADRHHPAYTEDQLRLLQHQFGDDYLYRLHAKIEHVLETTP